VPELGDQLFGETIDEVVVGGVAGEVVERQHHQPRSRRRRPRLRLGAAAIERADEAIADPGQGLDEARPGGVVAQDGAQALHHRVDAVLEVDRGAVRPQAATDVLAGDDVARAIEHQREQLERLVLEPDGLVAAAHLAQAHVDEHVPELHDRVWHGWGLRC
jgi:hypothetical protein